MDVDGDVDRGADVTNLTIIQARCGSSRLPRKVLADIAGRPMIWHVIQRAKTIGWPVVVATTVDEDDDDLVAYLESIGQRYFCGSTTNVLERFVQCVEWWEDKTGDEISCIARATGDSPLLSLAHCKTIRLMRPGEDVLRVFFDEPLAANEGVEVFSRYVLEWLEEHWSHDALTMEHVTPRVYMCPRQFHVARWAAPRVCGKFSIDTQADLDLVRRIYDELWRGEGHLIRQRDAAALAQRWRQES